MGSEEYNNAQLIAWLYETGKTGTNGDKWQKDLVNEDYRMK